MVANRVVRILVLGAGGNVSQGIIKALKISNIPIRIFGACIGEYSKGLYMCDEGYICPYARDESFIPWVIRFCNEKKIDIIFTGVEENVIKLAKFANEIKDQTNAVFISSTYDQLVVGQDKFLTCEWLKNAGCNYPKYQLWIDKTSAQTFADSVGYPIIAKPRNGKSSSGIHVINSAKELNCFDDLSGYVLEECIGDSDSEYTIGCYVDKNGSIQRLLAMHRKLQRGTTIWARTINNQKIIDECTKICNAFEPKGPLNIQLRLNNDGIPVCFELNVRFSGTTAIRAHFGFEDVKAMIFEYIFDMPIDDCFNLKTGEVFRFDEEMYLLDNTVESMRAYGGIEDIQSCLL